MIYVSVSCSKEGLTFAEFDGGVVIFTPLCHKTKPSVFFTPSL